MDYPEDLGYTAGHEWVKTGNDAVVRIGITAYAADALSDVVFVALPAVGDEARAGDSVAELESTKSVSEVFAPVAGVISRVNDRLAETPETINADPYGEGWLFEMEVADAAELDDLLTADSYAAGLG